MRFLEYWGALFFLINKIFFSRAERARARGEDEREQQHRIKSWTYYLVGLPAVVALLGLQRGYLAATVEAAGAPSMILGLVRARRGQQGKFPWVFFIFAFLASLGGLGYSVYVNYGLTTWTQYCEVGLAVGYFIGTLVLAASGHRSGYLWYVLMHVSTGIYFFLQVPVNWVFGFQQVASLVFVLDAYHVRGQLERPQPLRGYEDEAM